MKVLFTTDGSAGSDHAMREGARLFAPTVTEAWVVAVAEPVTPMMDYQGLGASIQVLVDREIDTAHQLALKAATLLETAGVRATPLDAVGDPGNEILNVARTHDVDAIVVGSHGRNALGRLVLGSVSDHVCHQWLGMTLVVRPRPEQT